MKQSASLIETAHSAHLPQHGKWLPSHTGAENSELMGPRHLHTVPNLAVSMGCLPFHLGRFLATIDGKASIARCSEAHHTKWNIHTII